MRPVHRYLQGSARPLTALYDVALLDLDGVVYVGSEAVPTVPAALAKAREAGMRLAFVTNNAARPPDAVAAHLTDLGIPAAPDEVITSAQTAAHYLADRLSPGARVLVLGTTGLEEALLERGLEPATTAADVEAVVQGFSPTMDWALLSEGAVAISNGALWVATNLDPTVPSARGRLPGNGSLVAALRHATGAEPIATGKPDPTMHLESVQRSRARSPIVVGDRLDTDIEGATAVGCPSLLVLSGVTSPRDLLDAPAKLRPTYLAADVSGLLDVHPEALINSEGATCGRWSAAMVADDSQVVLRLRATAQTDSHDEDDHLDALRALSAAMWAHGGEYRAGEGAHGTSGNDESHPSVEVRAANADSGKASAKAIERLGLA